MRVDDAERDAAGNKAKANDDLSDGSTCTLGQDNGDMADSESHLLDADMGVAFEMLSSSSVHGRRLLDMVMALCRSGNKSDATLGEGAQGVCH